jgi:hypothetical protein
VPNNVEQAKIKKAIKSFSLSARVLLSFHPRPHIDDLVVAARITGHGHALSLGDVALNPGDVLVLLTFQPLLKSKTY